MKRLMILSSFTFLLVLSGCDPAKEEPTAPGAGGGGAPAKSAPTASTKDSENKTGEGAANASSSKLSEEELAAINKLPEADRPLAIAQTTCPVSGDNLGSMEAPLKVTFEGKSAFLCCKSCKKEFDADPAKFLAKIGSKK